jgi:DNA-binding NarL/FixJ family response regulator
MAAPIRVLVADDHTMIRQGLVSLLKSSPEFEVVGEAADGNEAVEKVLEARPDVAVLDLSMPRLGGLEAALRIRKARPKTRVLVLTMHDDEEYVLRTVRAGASGYVVKDGAASELLAAIRAVSAGQGYFGPQAARALASRYEQGRERPDDPYERLTPREREVFQLLVEGRTNAEVAEVLFISPKTVDNHRTRLMERLGVHSAAELVRFAARRGLLL